MSPQWNPLCVFVCVLGVISVLVMAVFPALGGDQTLDRWHWSVRLSASDWFDLWIDNYRGHLWETNCTQLSKRAQRGGGGIRSSWSWITFTDWIRNLQQFDWIASQPSFFLLIFCAWWQKGGLQGTDLMMGHFSLAITLCNLYNDTVKQKSLQPAITYCSFLF